jgi:hypothetical protein
MEFVKKLELNDDQDQLYDFVVWLSSWSRKVDVVIEFKFLNEFHVGFNS